MKLKFLLTRFLALGIVSLTLFQTIGISEFTINSKAAELQFIPFRSSIVNYITEHSGDKNQEIIDEWLRIWAEQSTYSGGASAWANTYYSEYTGDRGVYVSDSDAKGKTLLYNSDFDSFLANTIRANGLDFMNQWLNASGNVTLTGGTFSGKQVFINYFNGTAYQNYNNVSNAIIELTQTADGYNWLQQYSYSKTGNTEATVGVGLLKLLTLNWDKLNDTQKNWCKEYLPFLLMNYRDYGANAIASNSKNHTLYDFMARSVNGAQCTYASKTNAGITLQQEFFNYVVASNEGFGNFVQNVIGGGTYTAVTPNRTISGINLSNIDTVYIIFSSDADADYTATSLGDGDYDWWIHGIWLSSADGSSAGKQSQNSQFVTVYNLIQKNSTVKSMYDEWVSKFKGKNSYSTTWNHLTEYSADITRNQASGLGNGAVYALSTAGGSTYDNYIANNEGVGPAIARGTTLESISMNFTGYNSRAYNNLHSVNGLGDPRDYNVRYAGSSWPINSLNYNTPLDYGTGSVSVSFGCTVSVANAVTIYATNSAHASIGISATTASNGTATISIPESAWKQYGNIYLKVQYNPLAVFDSWYTGTYTNGPSTLSWTINSVKQTWNSAQSCINGHDWNAWTDNRISVFNNWSTENADNPNAYKLTVSRTCKNEANHKEVEVITPEVTYESEYNRYVYTYSPSIIDHEKITIYQTIDVGTGTATYTKSNPGSYYGTWTAYSNVPIIEHVHDYRNGYWYARTYSIASVSGTLVIKSAIIKCNVKTISVNLTTTGTVTLKDANNNVIATKSGSGTLTLDVSSLSIFNKQGCYLQIGYNNTNSVYSEIGIGANGQNWDLWPSSLPCDVTASVNNIKITY